MKNRKGGRERVEACGKNERATERGRKTEEQLPNGPFRISITLRERKREEGCPRVHRYARGP